MPKILLIEDNQSIAEGLSYAFQREGYEVLLCSKLSEARKNLSQNEDIIILDIMLPDGNGIDFYKNDVKACNIPTIILTAIDDENSVVEALDIGAEDYITKPFSTRELLVRIKKCIQRNPKNEIIVASGVTFDMDKMAVYSGGQEITLTVLEKKILAVLFQNIGRTVTRESLIEKIWEWTGNDVYDHTITVYLKRIREKLGIDVIKTVKGIGYRIEE